MSVFRVRLTQGDSRSGDGTLDRFALLNGAISGATNAAPIVITTTAAHGLVSGTRVTVFGIVGNTAANGDWIITVLSTTTFSLNTSNGNGSYVSGGNWQVDSNQRTMFCMGPNKTNRKLNDGQVFTDCNYWKQFTYPTLPYNQAFIQVVTDDGSVYIPGQPSNFVRSYSVSVAGGTTPTTGTTVNVLGDNGGVATWAVISPTADVQCITNGVANSSFTISGGTTFTFSIGDVNIATLQFGRTASGSSTVNIELGVMSQCLS